jgi:hypothetical protein
VRARAQLRTTTLCTSRYRQFGDLMCCCTNAITSSTISSRTCHGMPHATRSSCNKGDTMQHRLLGRRATVGVRGHHRAGNQLEARAGGAADALPLLLRVIRLLRHRVHQHGRKELARARDVVLRDPRRRALLRLRILELLVQLDLLLAHHAPAQQAQSHLGHSHLGHSHLGHSHLGHSHSISCSHTTHLRSGV